LIDSDVSTYSMAQLRDWKRQAESEAEKAIGERPTRQAPVIAAVAISGRNAIRISGHNAVHIGPGGIQINGPVIRTGRTENQK
jgi:hypothetical protein